MRRSPFIRASAAALAMSALGACSPRGPAYAVNLSPPHTVGQKTAYLSTATSESRFVVTEIDPDKISPRVDTRAQKSSAHFEADAEVVAVFPNGTSQKVMLVVKTLSATADGQPVAGLPEPGAKIIAEKTASGEISFLVDDHAAPEDVLKVLRSVIHLGGAKYTIQEGVGPKTPVTVGAEWPINRNALLAQRDEFPGATDATGAVKLVSATGTGDNQVLVVSGHYTVIGMIIPGGIFVLDSGRVEAKFTASLPANPTQGTTGTSLATNVQFQGSSATPQGVKFRIVGHTQNQVTEQSTPR